MSDSERFQDPYQQTEKLECVPLVAPSVEYDLRGEEPLKVPIRPDFRYPIEIRLGNGPITSPCYLVHGAEHPDLHAAYVLVQPDVFRADPRQGRVAIHDGVRLGRQRSPKLRLGPEVSRDHCSISDLGPDLVISDYSRNGTWVKLHPDDVDDVPFDWFNRDMGLGREGRRHEDNNFDSIP